MSYFEDKLELLKKKANFFNEIFDKFSKEELSEYRKASDKIWAVKSKVWELTERIREIEMDNKKSHNEMKKITMGFIVFVALISIITFLTNKSTIDYGFTILGAGLIFILVRINHQIGLSASTVEEKNNKLAITQLEVLLSEFKLYHMPDMDAYMKVYEKKRYSSESLSDEDNYILSEFDVEGNLAIAESMGYSQPTFWY
jgi:hypothetical protein